MHTYLETINGDENLENENEVKNCTLVNNGVHEETRFMDLESFHVHPTQKSAANKKNLQLEDSTLTLTEILEKWQIQNGRCFISDIDLANDVLTQTYIQISRITSQ